MTDLSEDGSFTEDLARAVLIAIALFAVGVVVFPFI